VTRSLAALGPFFAVDGHPPGAAPQPPWRPLEELTSSPAVLRARVETVRETLAARGGRPVGAIEPRVPASAVHLGIAARLTAPALGAAVLGHPLDLDPGRLWWQDTVGGPVPLSVPEGEPPAGEWDRRLFDELLVPFASAIGQLVPISHRVLWGNVASGVNTAARLVAGQRPDLAADAWLAAGRLFARPELRGERKPPGPAFRRSSCCLFYRLEPEGLAALCGDCVLGGD
jgi:FhuF 2Fe-2S C-terminal domain